MSTVEVQGSEVTVIGEGIDVVKLVNKLRKVLGFASIEMLDEHQEEIEEEEDYEPFPYYNYNYYVNRMPDPVVVHDPSCSIM